MPIIKLKSADGEILDVDEEVAKTMLEGLGIADFDDEPLPLPNVNGAILKKAANYLNLKGLLDVTCKTVASMIKGKTPEQIRQTFNLENTSTPEEEEQV